MITGIDHLVILVTDLDAAMDDYARLGFTVARGGAHPSGTHNALIALADGAYLELIAFEHPDQPSDHPWQDAIALGEGLIAFALEASDLTADAVAIRARGLRVDEPADGSRLRPDGVTVAWRNTGVGAGQRGRQRPFLIEDVTPRSLRVATGRLAQHANGAVSVVDVTLAVADVRQAATDLAAILDRPAPEPSESDGWRWIRFPTARGDLVVAQPLDPTSAAATTVAARGDHLYAATLGVMIQGGEPLYVAERAHGANLRLTAV
jgi:catechol 2,3-dioxygenase-like lactoylglutathione lyase family enzyme